MRSPGRTSLYMEKYQCWSILGFHSRSFISRSLIYTNNQTEGFTTDANLFADGASLFSVLHDTQGSANELRKGLEIINNCSFQ